MESGLDLSFQNKSLKSLEDKLISNRNSTREQNSFSHLMFLFQNNKIFSKNKIGRLNLLMKIFQNSP